MELFRRPIFGIGLALLLGFPALSHAQATRTWVSGVGDDVNPCSRTAPCKTFQGTISKTAAGGEINVLDPGGFGAVTITKSITISSENFEAGVLVSGTNGIIVNAAATDIVVLRGLDIEGLGTGVNGIRFLAGGTLQVEKCTINHFAQKGISFEPSGAASLYVSDTVIRNNSVPVNGGGISIKPATGGSAKASIDRVRLEGNLYGLRVDGPATVAVSDSVASGNSGAGFQAVGVPGETDVTLSSVVSTGNGTGVASSNSAILRLSDVLITGNATGIDSSGRGNVQSFGNSQNYGNGVNGGPTESAIAQQ